MVKIKLSHFFTQQDERADRRMQDTGYPFIFFIHFSHTIYPDRISPYLSSSQIAPASVPIVTFFLNSSETNKKTKVKTKDKNH